ncbi:MAG: M23 family metallopeptidase [Leptolyngbya sp. SIO1D8]|nr:M23 family metallopeptidase [Leptolyngbya sp. SIO1D8]
MRFQLPKPYTILITRTGETPIAIKLRPLPIIIASLMLATIPIAWVTKLVYNNVQLAKRNRNLTETASEVLLELETLDEEIEDLRERAGLPEEGIPASQPAIEQSQGGVENTTTAEDLFQLAKTLMPQLNSHLEAQVRPALEETLAEETARAAAFPSAKPLKGVLDVSSEFGLRPNPFGGRRYEIHQGIDFRGPIGMPVYATADGVVTKAEFSGGYGRHVVIDHGYDHSTLYAHMSVIEVDVGDEVKRGDIIGALGNSGRSSGPHLHYEIHRNNQAVNPRYYLQLNDNL